MKSLIIVESPTKAKTLSRFLGGDYMIEATLGHIRDLPEKKFGININNKAGTYEFLPQYQIISERRKKVAEIKKIAKEIPQIILATDPDREGEAIAYHTAVVLGGDKKNRINPEKIKRIVFHEITKSAIDQALSHPRSIDLPLVNAQQARRILDRLVGYKLSPLLWYKLGKSWLSAGRVQTVAVRLIVEREREIQNFKPLEYWLIDVEVKKNSEIRDQISEMEKNNIGNFLIRLTEINGKKADLKNREETDKIVNNLKVASYQVESVDRKEVRRYPYPPFTTSTLQQAASNKYGWSAKKTMRTAQMLYEEGYITYHRTDSTNLAEEAITMVRSYINNVYGEKYLPGEPKFYKTKSKVAQEAHEAIRPTDITLLSLKDFEKLDPGMQATHKRLPESMGRDAEFLYNLIWRRFICCQMTEAVFDQTSVTVKGTHTSYQDQYALKAVGQKMKFDGWLRIYDDGKNDTAAEKNNENDGEKNKNIPDLAAGENLLYQNIIPQQKFTEPPPRFNEASLIKALEEKGIGRPSTYAPIISTIQDRKYVEKVERKFIPTDLGFLVVDFLIKYFPEIFDVAFTASMENNLDEIANGKFPWDKVIGDFYGPFVSKLDTVFKVAEKVKMDMGTTDEKCPQCGSGLVYKMSKYGKFLACSGYPNCKFTKNIIETVGIKCPRCGAEMIVKRTRKGKHFYGCAAYPKCNFAAWKKEDIK